MARSPVNVLSTLARRCAVPFTGMKGSTLTMSEHPVEVIGGVDTHADTHTAAAIDTTGRLLGHQQFPTGPDGYQALQAWLAGFGTIGQIGVEGTSSYGAGLYRHLHAQGITVLDVDRPNRRTRRRRGKNDFIDAESAACAVLAGTATTISKTRTGVVETLRAITVPAPARSRP